MFVRLLLVAAVVSACASDYSNLGGHGVGSESPMGEATVAALQVLAPATAGDVRPQEAMLPHARLAAAIAVYRGIAAKGGWSPVPAGEVLRSGSEGPRVLALRARLSITGDLTAL